MSYPNLMRYWAAGGDPVNLKVKNPKRILEHKLPEITRTPEFESIVTKWLMTADKSSDPDKLLIELGKYLAKEYKEIFGVVGPLMAPNRTGTPLVATGDLKSSVSYATSKTKRPRQ